MSMSHKTHEWFIQKLYKINPNIFKEYVFINKYSGMDKSLLLYGRYGLVKIRPNTLFLGSSPNIQSAVNKTNYFIKQSKEIYGNIYSYEKTEYKGAKYKVIITDSDNNDFTVTPSNYLSGCKLKNINAKSNTKQIKYKCNTLEKFKRVSNKKHNFRYDYSRVIYTTGDKKVDIICPVHGVFSQKAQNHMSGNGCPRCAKIHFDIFNTFRNKSIHENIKAKLYIIEMFNKNTNEVFYKIGITTKTIEDRFKPLKKYKYKIIEKIDGDLFNIIFLENYIHEKLSKYSYIPEYKFDGHTECFSKIDDNIIEFCYADLDDRINKFIKEEAITNEID